MYHGVAGTLWIEGPLYGTNWVVAVSLVLWLVRDVGLRTRRPVENIVYHGVSRILIVLDGKQTSINRHEPISVATTAQ